MSCYWRHREFCYSDVPCFWISASSLFRSAASISSLFKFLFEMEGAEHNQLTMNFPSSWISEGLGKTWNLPLTTCVCVCVYVRVGGVIMEVRGPIIIRARCYFNEKKKPSGRTTELDRGWRRVEGVGCPSFKSLAARSAVPDRRTMGATEPGGGGGLQGGRSTGTEILRKKASVQEKWGVSKTWYQKPKALI